MPVSSCSKCLIFWLSLLLPVFSLYAQSPLEGEGLLPALQNGGLVLVMRHASSPRQPPEAGQRNADNLSAERQLSEQGRQDARIFGEALSRLGIELGEVASSPAYRAVETARLAGLTRIGVHDELGNQGMQESGDEKAIWLLQRVISGPVSGNLLIITHSPNINRAFPNLDEPVAEGEILVFDPENLGPLPRARIRISDWNQF